MKKCPYGAALIALILGGTLFFANFINAYAVDGITLPTDEGDREVVSVSLPTLAEEEDSPFDFILDPQGLIYETDAALYGGGKVEEGSYLLFRHRGDSEYLFSGTSDFLTAENRGNVPVEVTVTAEVAHLGEIVILDNDDFEDREDCSLYLALIDDEGNEEPIPEDGKISVKTELRAALTTYSFGLRGACNPNGPWEDIVVHPKVRVTWKIEQISSGKKQDDLMEEEEDPSEDLIDEEITEQEEILVPTPTPEKEGYLEGIPDEEDTDIDDPGEPGEEFDSEEELLESEEVITEEKSAKIGEIN